MNKRNFEIIASVASVAILIALMAASKYVLPAGGAGYGRTAALLIFMALMSILGFKLAEMPEK
ncbi:MAG: hypothetical protein J5U17_12945 [Candidatus Methanoperedens sp.]|nr:hypothetical protein [Candidatus Methanoperedens sp.]MCE8426671.1 hypothetical protein [Candidatus Methanoperedens sp.]MCE8429343.1 hypothetical protein [Candidatus Methanoperedens sp.]